MQKYRLRNGKKYKKRRTALALIFMTLIILAGVYAFLGNNNKDRISASSPTPSPTTPPTAVLESTEPPASSPDQGTEATNMNDGTAIDDHGSLPAIGSIEKSGKTESIAAKAQNFISNLSGKYGVHFIDLATGESFGINDRDIYVAASTSKLPINLLLYNKIEAGEIDPESILTYTEEDVEPGTGIIQDKPFGTEYTVRETAKLSIIYSDNAGVNMILRTVGGKDAVSKYIIGLGGEVYYGKGHRTSPRDMALVSKELYRLYLNNPEVYGEFINNLENTKWNERINGKLPKNVKVAHKIGNQPTYSTFNDVGIVFASHPYVLSVMAAKVDYETACKGISQLSKMIYDEVEAYAKK